VTPPPISSAATKYRHYGGDHIISVWHAEHYAHANRHTLLFCRGKYMRGEPCFHHPDARSIFYVQ
jgi:hypothetical protein